LEYVLAAVKALCLKTYNQPRPTLNDEDGLKEARDAVERLVEELQAGWDQSDAEITDRRVAADVVWGSPFGATVHGYDLHAIHVKLKKQSKGGSSSRFEVERILVPASGVAVAHIKRLALLPNGQPVEPSSTTNEMFSEMALYVMVRRNGTWWVAAGQNTPIRPGGAA
jgi:uncharacterized protein (TIGR02246 family)